MILAGGLSTRLYPLTLHLPKPLVPVLDRPVVAHVIEYLQRWGISEIAINVHYFADEVERFVADGAPWGVTIAYLREPELKGSAGAVKQMAPFFDGTFVVIGCDDVTDVDLAAAIEFHRLRGAQATIVLAEVGDVHHYGAVVIDSDGRILQFQEKPAPGTERSKLANTGIYIFEPSVLDRIPADTFYDFGKQVFPEMLAAGARFFGMPQQAYWCDIGTPSEYRRVHFDALRGRVRLRAAPESAIKDSVLVGSGAQIAPSARVVGPACIGSGGVIEAKAVVESSILWSGARVGEGAQIRDAVIGLGARVEPGARIIGGEHAPTP